MFEIIRANPTQDYLDFLTRSVRTKNITRLEHHVTKLAHETALSYGLTEKQYNEITVLLESEVV